MTALELQPSFATYEEAQLFQNHIAATCDEHLGVGRGAGHVANLLRKTQEKIESESVASNTVVLRHALAPELYDQVSCTILC